MNRKSQRSALLASLLAGSVMLSACVSTAPKKDDAEPQTGATAAPAATPAAQAATPAAPEAAPCVEEPSKGKPKKGQTKSKSAASNCKDAPAPNEAAAAKGEAAASGTRQGDGGYNLSGNKPVTDSKKVESGQGTKVRGINDWEGEITGIPAANSPFRKLKIGMPLKQVTDLIGEPSDQGAYVTGKAFIPFYFGSDKSRWEAVYRNHGRLIFSDQAGFGGGSWHLTWIIHNSKEGAYR